MADSPDLGGSDREAVVQPTQSIGATVGSGPIVGIPQPKRAREGRRMQRAGFAAAAEREWVAFPDKPGTHLSWRKIDRRQWELLAADGTTLGGARRSVSTCRWSGIRVEGPDQKQETDRPRSIRRWYAGSWWTQ